MTVDRRAPPPKRTWWARLLVQLFYALLFAAAWLAFTMPAGSTKTVSYSDFIQMVADNHVTEVVITPRRVRGTVKGSDEVFETLRIEDPQLLERLQQHGVKFTGQEESTWLRDVASWLLPLLVVVLLWVFFLGRMAPAQGAMAFERSRAKIYAEDDVKVTFADVAGIDEATEELREIVEFLKHPTKYTDLGGRIPKGVLLLGPPGTGKTLLARAVAGEAHVPFFSLSGSEFVELFVGVGAARVRDLFAQAESRAPCIIFIDELDALGKMRVPSALGTHEEREQTLNQLLAEMDGFDARKGVIVMAATNRPEVLDPALLRAGRFDRQVVVDRPDVRGREAILRLHAKAVRLAPDVDLNVVAARTVGCAGADLANLINEATLLAARKDHAQVSMADFEEAIDRLLAGLKRKRVMSVHERAIVAHHEAGHAIVASLLPDVDPVHKISIVQRGFEALGHTLQVAPEEHYLVTRRALLNQLAVLLGGRSAEEIAFQEVSTGAQNDLQRATELARAMVTEYGMSDTLGPVAFRVRARSRFLDLEGAEPEPFAEETARDIDAEIKQLIAAAHARASDILRERRDVLDELAKRLLEHEVVDGSEVRALIGARDTTPHAA
ncbi:MAG TPA: ATP-dependent zinc metalloprotease FtsH [Vicinamibacterales bacterium]|nr:ATP-dependent zinc metalloprotease FtsH [Vicinamibacterales bacterium]